jgi:hypothetical protein
MHLRCSVRAMSRVVRFRAVFLQRRYVRSRA